MPTKRLFSANALACELDQDRRAVAQALAAVPPDGTDKAGSPRWFLSTALPHLPLGPGSVEDERRRWFKARAARAEMELAAARGELVSVDAVEQLFGAEVTIIKTKLSAFPTRYAPRLAAATTALEVRAILGAAVEEVLNEMSADGEAVALAAIKQCAFEGKEN